MSGHTPGPWKANEGHPSDVWHVDMPTRHFSVTVSRSDDDYGMPVEEVQANARLIAAAPELLAALKELIGRSQLRLRKGEGSGDPATLRLCRAAIDKTEGSGE